FSGVKVGKSSLRSCWALLKRRSASSTAGSSPSEGNVFTHSPVSPRSHPSVAMAMCVTVARTDDHPGAGSVAYCSAVSDLHAAIRRRFAHALYFEQRLEIVGHRSMSLPSSRGSSSAFRLIGATLPAPWRQGKPRGRCLDAVGPYGFASPH